MDSSSRKSWRQSYMGKLIYKELLSDISSDKEEPPGGGCTEGASEDLDEFQFKEVLEAVVHGEAYL